MLPVAEDGESGFQFCNLVEQNGAMITSKEKFFESCKAAAVLGTLQAGYTNFKYLSDATRRITEREALLGVSITGWMNNPKILFDEEILKEGARIVLETNAIIADLIGINKTARATCAKPSGNASVLLGTESGIHGAHSDRYFRNVQMNEEDAVLHLLRERNPKMVEKSVWSANGTDYVVSFPVKTKPGSITKAELYGVKQLEYVKKAQQFWVEAGTNVELCVDPNLRHNISNTISVDDWDAVEEYIFENKQWFAGISLLSATGDKDYPQAPFTEVLTGAEIMRLYGQGSLFASGLIVDALHAFNNDLWVACSSINQEFSDNSEDLLKRDWVRRAKKYADRFFGGDIKKMEYCLKDCYNLHKWLAIEDSMQAIDFSTELSQQTFVDADTLASGGCVGGACEISF